MRGGRAVTVEMTSSQFAPAVSSSPRGRPSAGGTGNAIAHTVTATAGATFDSGTVEPGGDFTWTALAKAGRVSSVCPSPRNDGHDRRAVARAGFRLGA